MSTPTEHDTEALAALIRDYLKRTTFVSSEPWGARITASELDIAHEILASDWLADHDAALIAKAKAEGAVEAVPRVIRDLLTEREHQVSIGYTPENDDRYATDKFVRWSATYARRCGKGREPGYFDRARLIQAAALLVAAVESMDRRRPRRRDRGRTVNAYGSDPESHQIKDGRFVCTAPEDAKCRTYPTCDCEAWCGCDGSPEDAADNHDEGGHCCKTTTKPGQGCWMEVWVNDGTGLEDSYGGDYEPDVRLRDEEGDIADEPWPDGSVTCDWDDCVMWEYAEVAP